MPQAAAALTPAPPATTTGWDSSQARARSPRNWPAGADPSTPALRAAAWRAARHGLGDRLVDPASGDLVPARQGLGSLLTFTSEALDDAGDLVRVQDVIERTLADGTAADRQRRLVDPHAPSAGLAGFRVG